MLHRLWTFLKDCFGRHSAFYLWPTALLRVRVDVSFQQILHWHSLEPEVRLFTFVILDMRMVMQTEKKSMMQCSAVQCSAVKCSAVQCSEVKGSAVRCSDFQCEDLHEPFLLWFFAFLFAVAQAVPVLSCACVTKLKTEESIPRNSRLVIRKSISIKPYSKYIKSLIAQQAFRPR